MSPLEHSEAIDREMVQKAAVAILDTQVDDVDTDKEIWGIDFYNFLSDLPDKELSQAIDAALTTRDPETDPVIEAIRVAVVEERGARELEKNKPGIGLLAANLSRLLGGGQDARLVKERDLAGIKERLGAMAGREVTRSEESVAISRRDINRRIGNAVSTLDDEGKEEVAADMRNREEAALHGTSRARMAERYVNQRQSASQYLADIDRLLTSDTTKEYFLQALGDAYRRDWQSDF